MSRRLIKDNKGSFAVMTAILLPVFFGLVGIAMEIGSWYNTRRAMQGAADAAAFSAAIAYTMGTPWRTEGLGVAAVNGFTNGVDGVTVAVNMPPTVGNYAGTAQAIEVIITKPTNPIFARFVGYTTGPIVPARAVAMLDVNSSDCVLALSKTASGAITLNGSTNINLQDCAIGDNSASSSAFTVKGSGNSLSAGSISVVGGESMAGSASISPGVDTGQAPTANPYASLTVPHFTDPAGCKDVKLTGTGSSTATLDANVPGNSTPPYNNQVISLTWPPGGENSGTANAMVICGDISVKGGSTLTLNPGVYILDCGSLIANNGSITGTGVTIIFTCTTTPNQIGTANIGGNVALNLTADMSGPFPGFVFFQDPNAALATNPPDATIIGTPGSIINGAVYFPAVNVTYGGNSTGGSTGCTQLIADTIQFSGNVSLNVAGCSSMGLSSVGPTLLVE